MGDPYLRTLLVNGATAVIHRIDKAEGATAIWIRRLLEKKPARVATVAIANKTARIVWAVVQKKNTADPTWAEKTRLFDGRLICKGIEGDDHPRGPPPGHTPK